MLRSHDLVLCCWGLQSAMEGPATCRVLRVYLYLISFVHEANEVDTRYHARGTVSREPPNLSRVLNLSTTARVVFAEILVW